MFVTGMLLYSCAPACYLMIPTLGPILILLLIPGYVVFSVVISCNMKSILWDTAGGVV
jgi:hypothetical protein